METEDLNFPKIGDTSTCAYSIHSPPLWNISPKGLSDPYQVPRKGTKRDEKDYFEAKLVSKGHRKSFSCVQNGKKITRVDDEEVPMDLLWEDFNEELSSATYFSTRQFVELRCAKALAVAKNSTSLVQTKNRPGMVVIVKILKKFFTLTNSNLKLFWQSD